ncbi:MAG: DUF3048 domain-containing protein [Acidimicrobiales bacterium]
MIRHKKTWIVVLAVALIVSACSSGSDDSSKDADAGDATASTPEQEGDDLDALLGEAGDAEPDTQTTEQPPDTAPTFTDGLWPLTGVEQPEGAQIERAALAIKIDNVEAARQQAGINEADIIYEERVEGGLSRLLAIYQSQDASLVGPIRSARSTDVPILLSLQDPLFAWSGANAAFAKLIQGADVKDVGYSAAPLGTYEVMADREAPSNLFSSTELLWGATTDPDGPPRSIFRYLGGGDALPEEARDVSMVSVSFGATDVEFRWDESLGGWVRSQNGTPFVDADGDVVAPENLVVQFVEYRSTDQVDSNGVAVPEAVLEARFAPVWYLVNGKLVTGSWQKFSAQTPFQYTFNNGRYAQLSPGQTWVVLVEDGDASWE